jgi:Zn-finger nucleic acid-binding protein
MNCAVCQNPMITLEMELVETDCCSGCGGIWLDGGELELLLGGGEQAAGLIRSFQPCGGREKHRRCPICDRKMEKINAGDNEAPIIIDRCPKGHGLWFDRGELAAVLERGRLDKEGKIQKLLGDLFNGEKSGKADQ